MGENDGAIHFKGSTIQNNFAFSVSLGTLLDNNVETKFSNTVIDKNELLSKEEIIEEMTG